MAVSTGACPNMAMCVPSLGTSGHHYDSGDDAQKPVRVYVPRNGGRTEASMNPYQDGRPDRGHIPPTSVYLVQKLGLTMGFDLRNILAYELSSKREVVGQSIAIMLDSAKYEIKCLEINEHIIDD